MEAAKLLLATNSQWLGLVPADRSPGTGVAPWAAGGGPLPVGGGFGAGRDYEQRGCPLDRGGQGYGVVLNTFPPPTGSPNTRWENASTFLGQPLNGAFTIWVRRELVSNTNGTFQDDSTVPLTNLVVTVEGVAPYAGASTAFSRTNQARRVLEMTWTLLTGRPCRQLGGQKGQGPSGENFDPCSTLSEGAAGSLGGAFGAAANRVGGAGALLGTGAQ